jgi:REP element-mobilizing transposase RayT
MPESYTNLLYHIIFSTKDRRPLITPDVESQLYDYVGGTIHRLKGICLELNGTEDHLHLLAKLRPERAVSDLLRDLKANASGCMRSSPRSGISLGNADTEHLLSANRMSSKSDSILGARRSTTAGYHFGMSSSST